MAKTFSCNCVLTNHIYIFNSPKRRAHYIRTQHSSFICRAIKSEFHAINRPVYDPNFAFSVRGVFWVFRGLTRGHFSPPAHTGAQRFMHPTAGAETQWIWYLCECPRCRFIISSERQHYFIICICGAQETQIWTRARASTAHIYARVWSVSAPGLNVAAEAQRFPSKNCTPAFCFSLKFGE